MFCKHNYRYTQGHFYCTKCGHRSYKERRSGRKNRKLIPIIIIASSILTVLAVIGTNGLSIIQDSNSKMIGETVSDTITKASNKIQGLSTQGSHSSFSGKDERLTPVPNKILTEDNFYAELVPTSIQVTEKERYNVINLTIDVNMQDLPFDGKVEFRDLYTTLKDEKSKSYSPDKTECSLTEYVKINGKTSDKATYNVCYSVEKSSTKFTIQYTEPQFNYHATRIGHLILDQNFFDYYDSNRNPSPSKIGTIELLKN